MTVRTPWRARVLPFGRLGLAVVCCALGGCGSFGPPRPATMASLDPPPRLLPAGTGGAVLLELESATMAGLFDAALAIEAGSPPRVQLQVFPEIGGTLLAVAVDEDGVTGELGGVGYRTGPDLRDAAPHPCLLLGVSLAEACAAIAPGRVLGERRCGERRELRLAPVLGGETIVELDATGAPVRLRCRVGRAAWTFDRDGELLAPGFRARLQWAP